MSCVCGNNPWTGIEQTCLLHYAERRKAERKLARLQQKYGKGRRHDR